MGWKAELGDPMFRRTTAEGRRFLDPESHVWPWETPETVREVTFGLPESWRDAEWIRFLAVVDPEAVDAFGDRAFETTYAVEPRARPDTDELIDRFIWVAHEGPEAALDLAERVGPLRLCVCHAIPYESCPTAILKREHLLPEPSLAWYLWAREVWLVVKLLSVLRTARGEDERRAAAKAFSLESLECWSDLERTREALSNEPEMIVAFPGAYEVTLPELRMVGEVLQGKLPERETCLEAVAERIRRWMRYGRVEPRLEVDPPRSFRFAMTGSGLFGAVAKRLCFVALARDDWAICHECGAPFTPTQKIRSNQKLVFCKRCRAKGAPQKHRQRRYRARKGASDE